MRRGTAHSQANLNERLIIKLLFGDWKTKRTSE